MLIQQMQWFQMFQAYSIKDRHSLAKSTSIASCIFKLLEEATKHFILLELFFLHSF